MPKSLDLQGKRFGRLTAIAPAGHNRFGQKTWLCRCDCGGEARPTTSGLTRGTTKSCGCARDIGGRTRTHGHTVGRIKPPEYRTWISMRRRCSDPRSPEYHYYGGRGIRVSLEWQDDFQKFFADVGPRPTDKHSLDRIDYDGDYEPGNVRWATATEQQNNRRNNIRVYFEGGSLTIGEIAAALDVPYDFTHRRLVVALQERIHGGRADKSSDKGDRAIGGAR